MLSTVDRTASFWVGNLATDRKQTRRRKPADQRVSEKLPPIYVTPTFLEQATAAADAEGRDWADFGRNAIEAYLSENNSPRVGHVTQGVVIDLSPEEMEQLADLARKTRLRQPTRLAEELVLRALEVGSDEVLKFLHGAVLATEEESRFVEDTYIRVTNALSTVKTGGIHTPESIDRIIQRFPEEKREQQRVKYTEFIEQVDNDEAKEKGITVEQLRWQRLEEAKQILEAYPVLAARIQRGREIHAEKVEEYRRRQEQAAAAELSSGSEHSASSLVTPQLREALTTAAETSRQRKITAQGRQGTLQQGALPTMHLQSVPDSIPTTPAPSQMDDEEIKSPEPLRKGQKTTKDELARRAVQAGEASLQASKRGSKKENGERAA